MRALPRSHAVLLGDGPSVAAPLHRAGVPVVVACRPLSATRFSRYVSGWLRNPRPDEDQLVDVLLAHAERHGGPLGLFFQQDEDLLLVSRRRDELASAYRFVVPDTALVEQLVDKAAFQELARRLALPVPPARVLDVSDVAAHIARTQLPVLVKPVRRDHAWNARWAAKAVLVCDEEDGRVLLAGLADDPGRRVVVQEHVPGPESSIESYHVYVDSSGETAGEFTGRKLRTRPASFGHTTALVTTDDAEVTDLGRQVTRRLGLRGVAKLDFKRDQSGKLWLLEVNARFNLWHHVGSAAGVNIPALVWADLVGGSRPGPAVARAGVTWCKVERDWLAARQDGMGLAAWLRWLSRCETRALGDPTRWLEKAVRPAYGRLRWKLAAGARD